MFSWVYELHLHHQAKIKTKLKTQYCTTNNRDDSKMNIDKKSVVSIEECSIILKNCLGTSDFLIENYEVHPFTDDGNGFLCDHILIIISFQTKGDNRSKRFFAKRFLQEDQLFNVYLRDIGAFRNERFAYEALFHMFPYSNDFAPKYYFGRDDLLVFEDLSDQGYVTVDNPNVMSLENVKFSLKLLARYHSGSIAYQELKSKQLGRRYCLIDDYQKFMPEPLFQENETFLGNVFLKARLRAVIALVDLLPCSQIAPEDFKRKLVVLSEEAFEIMKPKTTFYNTLCHGEPWGKNVMFRYENNVLVDGKLIDFQMQRYAPPAHDVLHFMFLTTDSKQRQSHYHALLRYYHNCLYEELKSINLDLNLIIPYSDFEASVHYLLPQIKLQTAYHFTFQSGNKEFFKNMFSNLQEFKRFVFTDDGSFAIDLFQTDPNFNRLLTQALIELKDLVTHHTITVEDCYKIIERKTKTDYDLLDYSLRRPANISGFLGDHYRLKIIISQCGITNVLHMFAKCAPKSKTRLNLAIGGKVFLKEWFVLETLIPLIRSAGVDDINECVVSHHLIRVNDVIVFDDLTFDDFRPSSQRVPFVYEELKVIVRKLAVYHASNIALEEKMSKNTGQSYRLSQFTEQLYESFFRTEDHNPSSSSIKLGVDTIPYQLELFGFDLTKEFKDKVQKALDKCYQLVKPSTEFRNVVCHGDLWADNIMVRYENGKPVDCRIIDYQILRYCPPAHDLLTLLFLTTTRAVRDKHLKDLIDFYYEHFLRVLVNNKCEVENIYTYEQFIVSCELFVPQAVCQTVLFYHFTMTNPAFMKDYIGDENLTRKIFLEDRKDFIKDMCERDAVYQARMRESLVDLQEMCLKYF
ncbi:hypothetical protein FQA39_LY16595 [Lamprigera yunnana]|nr:hypothetical protein FQA39_LY16595 [Lamprigera yunnana]